MTLPGTNHDTHPEWPQEVLAEVVEAFKESFVEFTAKRLGAYKRLGLITDYRKTEDGFSIAPRYAVDRIKVRLVIDGHEAGA